MHPGKRRALFFFKRVRNSLPTYLEVGFQSEGISDDFWFYSSPRLISDARDFPDLNVTQNALVF